MIKELEALKFNIPQSELDIMERDKDLKEIHSKDSKGNLSDSSFFDMSDKEDQRWLKIYRSNK